MSEYMFGVTRRRLDAAEVSRRDRICRDEGGTGYVQIEEPPGQGTWLGWFTGPNRGDPFDRELAERVLDAVEAAEKGGAR